MKKAIMTDRIRKEISKQGYADTKKYRYQEFHRCDRAYIARIELAKLDTTAAIDSWEIVEEYK